jgi:para-aminobenzoate synthetase/4-amino-4-deoxychorismate lyase
MKGRAEIPAAPACVLPNAPGKWSPALVNSVLLHDPAKSRWLLFRDPVQVHIARSPSEVRPILLQVEREVKENQWYAAGFISYEAAPAFDAAFETRPETEFPLAWFGVYREVLSLDALPACTSCGEEIAWRSELEQGEYERVVRQIREWIRTGETYQANYTFRLRAGYQGHPWDLFNRLVQAQGAHYSAFIQLERWAVCSASPELFFQTDGGTLLCRPMKGTRSRGLWSDDDQANAAALAGSEKERAENIMIVDMVRNDLGRVAETGSVVVPRLFHVEQYPTLWQMTSDVNCRTKAGLTEILGALFPPASITGAPKVRTMTLLSQVERSPRRIYTGSIGYLGPDGNAQFNVAIRTVLVDKSTGTAEYGTGSGIVWDSDPDKERRECEVKSRVLEGPAGTGDFGLIETMLWKPGEGLVLGEEHWQRLTASARYFGWRVALPEILRQWRAFEKTLPPMPQRVRAVLTPDARISFTARIPQTLPPAYRVRLSKGPVSSANPLLYHKTTRRAIYETAKAEAEGCEDALLWNENGEVTEATIANLFLETEEGLITPPLSCGVLPGVCRSSLLKAGGAKEKVIRVGDLGQDSRIWLGNSVQGLWRACLLPGPNSERPGPSAPAPQCSAGIG